MSDPQKPDDRFPSIESITAKLAKSLAVPAPEDPQEPEVDGRETTRFLNFRRPERSEVSDDPTAEDLAATASDPSVIAVLKIVEGPGVGEVFPIAKHFVNIGRSEGQDVRLCFGDDAISRKGHVSIAYYGQRSGFLLRDGLKPNPVYVNGVHLRGEDKLVNGDLIRVGETSLRFSCP